MLMLTTAACGSKESKKATNQSDKKAVAVNVDTALQSQLKKFCTQPRVKGRFGLYV